MITSRMVAGRAGTTAVGGVKGGGLSVCVCVVCVCVCMCVLYYVYVILYLVNEVESL